MDFGSILNTIMEALSSFLPMDEITGALQPVLDAIMKVLAGTQAAGAGVNALRSAVHDRLHASDVRFPGSVCTSMGMGHLDAKGNILATNFTLCHVCTSFEDDII